MMPRARKRTKLEEGELSSSDDDCIIVGTRVKEECEPKHGVAQGSSHHLPTSKANTAPDPFCSECCRYFQSNAEKERHYSKWHYGNLCHACDEGFPSPSELLQHKAGHTETPICCVGCEKRFKCYSAMMDHLEHGTCESACTGQLVRSVVATHCARFHPSSTRNIDLQCPTCERKYLRMAHILRHLENRTCTLRNWIEETGLRDLLVALKVSIEENKASTFSCNVCRKSFDKEVALEMHQREKHEHVCRACKTYFASAAKKQKHVMSGLSVKPGTFFCDHCDPNVRFGSEKELCDHLWLDHMACGPCGQMFETTELKKQHDAEAHNRCAVCYRFFASSVELIQHYATHIPEPPVIEPPVVVPAPVETESIPRLQRASRQLYP
ncbi:hypothetical protein FGADI_4197 [Fusarium gaditjirri]|uniref:C2H2-type domain-containing protein n=1 Tax=Fusarium gaditjirri TaxID=282569 RepID=A0A8H4TE01_9HYPO|nr:hypothetical protein FGADI_4197 [Fusarium gaditjirri]